MTWEHKQSFSSQRLSPLLPKTERNNKFNQTVNFWNWNPFLNRFWITQKKFVEVLFEDRAPSSQIRRIKFWKCFLENHWHSPQMQVFPWTQANLQGGQSTHFPQWHCLPWTQSFVQGAHAEKNDHRHISLKVPNVKFNFDGWFLTLMHW